LRRTVLMHDRMHEIQKVLGRIFHHKKGAPRPES
jgi:hypothetical protein